MKLRFFRYLGWNPEAFRVILVSSGNYRTEVRLKKNGKKDKIIKLRCRNYHGLPEPRWQSVN
jgi:hypothetical protein